MASIRRRESGKRVSWQVRWYGPDGKLKSRTFGTQREAKAYRAKIETLGAVARPRGAGDRLRLGEALNNWLQANEDRWRAKTQVINTGAAAHMESINNVRLDRLTPEMVNESVQDLSPYVARQAVNAVKGAVKHAQSLGYEVVPATANMSSPRPPERRQRALSVEEVEALANEIGGNHGEIVRLLAYTGLRVGELAGLEIRDYDSTRGRLAVVRAVSWATGGAVVGAPKTDAGQRVVPVIGVAREIIERRIEENLSNDQSPHSPLILGPRRGMRWNPNNWRRDAGWNDALLALGMGRVRLHDLRHTYASIVRRSGADIYVLQKVLGHREIATTIDRYGHLYDDEIDVLGSTLDSVVRVSHGHSMATN